MGQTLTHGIYLPDEGERNCYNGLAANWQLLDGAVGTVAEHTAALAEKANAVHTHTKSQITDFPAYGTTAGTICEGNDSRLSDARTPVAHTHLTADVTDLLNTSHEWTKEQVCDEGFTAQSTTMERCVTPATTQHINFTFKDKNGKGFGAIRRYFKNSGEQQIQFFGNTRIKDGQYDETGSDEFFGFSEVILPNGTKYFSFDGYLNNSIRPRLTNTYQLGDSSYQWNNLYAKNYFYNGTAWGLDKTNLWSGTNQFYNSVDYRDSVFSGKNPSSTYRAVDTFKHLGNDNTYWGGLKHNWLTDGYSRLQICIANHKLVNDAWTQGFWAINFAASKNFFDVGFYPSTNNSINLGTSDYKWKSFNGINPGALSLPDTTREEPIDTTNWVYNYTSANVYYPPEDGWLAIACSGSDYIQIDGSTGWGITLSKGYDGYCTGIIPVKKNVRTQIRIKETSSGSVVVRKASFYPGTGDPSFTVTPLNNS